MDDDVKLARQNEIKRRQKLLYGVKDVKKLLEKSEDSMTTKQEVEKESDSEKDIQPDHSKTKCRDIFKASNFIISMNSSWKTVFDTFVLLVVAYSIFTSLFYVAFDPVIPPLMAKFDDIALYVFIIDFALSKLPHFKFFPFIFIFLDFFIEYQDQETFLYIRDHKKIAIKYFKNWMIPDLIATFPVDKILE